MRKICLIGGVLLLVIGLTVAGVIAGNGGNGNGFPKGPHYTLIIKGTNNPDKVVGDSMGHTMFVREDDLTYIYMTQDDNGGFKVTDRNGVTPDPDPNPNGPSREPDTRFNIADLDGVNQKRTHWLVFARALGKPGGTVIIDPEGVFTNEQGDEVFMLDGPIIIKSHNSSTTGKGKPDTVELTGAFYVTVTVWVDSLTTGIIGEIDPGELITYTDEWIFDIPELEEYYWKYNNNGVKTLQVRFYEDTEGLWP
ncbi:hypothetical protein ACFL6S_14555 [Candidatus Poribacteria bacterium]